MSLEQSIGHCMKELQSPEGITRRDGADQLAYLLENTLTNKATISHNLYSMMVEQLIQGALAEEDPNVKESIFSALLVAACFPESEKVDYRPIIDSLKSLDDSLLEYALPIVGFTRNEEHESLLVQYLSHSDECVRQSAREALVDLLSGQLNPEVDSE